MIRLSMATVIILAILGNPIAEKLKHENNQFFTLLS